MRSQGLPRTHQVKIIIRFDVENAKDLVKHVAMLSGYEHDWLELPQMPCQFFDNRRQLDCLGPGPKAKHHAPLHGTSTRRFRR